MTINRFDSRITVGPITVRQEPDQAAPASRANNLLCRVEGTVASHPMQSLIAALAAGAIVGWIIKRR